jgi:hypothetical protein
VGVGYLALLPSPEDLPRNRRQIQGSAKVKNQIVDEIRLDNQDDAGAGGSGIRHAESNW